MDSMARLNRIGARLMHKYNAHGATDITGFGLLGHAQALARNQKNEVSFVIHNLPVIAKMAAVAKACGNMFQLLQGTYEIFLGGFHTWIVGKKFYLKNSCKKLVKGNDSIWWIFFGYFAFSKVCNFLWKIFKKDSWNWFVLISRVFLAWKIKNFV